MITIFRDKQDIPQNMEYIELNDLFFVQNNKIRSSFHDVALDIDKLSAGCKTLLNVLYYPDRVFCLKECGDNALELLYGFEKGYVYSEYAMIPFNMKSVTVQTKGTKKVISDYEELKEWWGNEK